MNEIIINNETKYKIDSICLVIVNELLTKLDIDNASLSINLVSDEYIQELNRDYRSKDKVTDVITFAYEDDNNFNDLFETRELGDIFIALDYVYNNSLKYSHTMAREMSFVLAHGILHTLGYDHLTLEEERVMFEKQEELISTVVEKGSELNEIFNR